MKTILMFPGQKFNKLTAIKQTDVVRRGSRLWEFKCDCGGVRIAVAFSVRSGSLKSCGCIWGRLNKRKVTRKRTTPASPNALYWVWRGMKQRVFNVNKRGYKDYGGRGIKICDAWVHGYKQFLLDMGPRPLGYTLERKDVNGNYCPENCIWATYHQQARNRRRNIFITLFGKTQTMKDWADQAGVRYSVVQSRIKDLKWDHIRALLTPTYFLKGGHGNPMSRLRSTDAWSENHSSIIEIAIKLGGFPTRQLLHPLMGSFPEAPNGILEELSQKTGHSYSDLLSEWGPGSVSKLP